MLKYLFDPNTQFLDTSGAIDAGGHLEVYLAYTDDAAATYADLSGHALNPQRIPLDSNGRATVAVDDGKSYRLEVYAEGGLLLWTVQPYMPSGTTVNLPVTVKGTENEIGVSESVSAREKTFTVSLAESVKKSISDNAKAISEETEARENADKELSDDIGVISRGLATETNERKSEDERLESLIGEKQGTLKDGDNIHIDGERKVNVVNRKTLQVKSPLTAEKLDTALVLGIRDGAFATAEALEAEAEARKNGDEQNRARIDKVDADLNSEIQNRIEAVSKKQDVAYFFNPDTSTLSEVNNAISKGMDIYSASGSNAVQWQGAIHGGYPTLTRLEDGVQYSWGYSDGSWVQTSKKLDVGTNSMTYDAGVPDPTVVTGPFTATRNLLNTKLLDADGGTIGYLIQSLGENGNVLRSTGKSLYWGDAPKEIPDYSKISYPTSNQTPGDELFRMGNFKVCGYTDNGGVLRLCIVPTDGETHSVSTNGEKGTCGADGLLVATSFYNSNPYMRLFIVDNGSFDICEAEIYAITGTNIATSSILYRVITDQKTGGSNG